MITELNYKIGIVETDGIDRLVIGYFDGFHKGHMTLLEQDLYKTSVLTFINHPSKIKHLYTNKEKVTQLDKLGLKNIFIYDLNDNLTAEEFVQKYLLKLEPKKIVVGSDFKFGSDQKTAEYLKEFFDVEIVEKYNNISTKQIKKYIEFGDIVSANKWLIWPYYRIGVVSEGKKIGRQIDIKTANIEIDETLVDMSCGIYVTKTIVNSKKYKSVTFLGKSDSFNNDNTPKIETHLFNYNGEDFYNIEIKVIFYQKIGEIKKYRFKFMLIKRIKKMIKLAKEYWNE